MPNWFTTNISPNGIRTLEDRIKNLDTLRKRIKTLQYNKTVTLLDIGSAEGLIGDWLLASNGCITGLDIDADKIKTAQEIFKKNSNYNFHVVDVSTLPSYKQKEFDVVLLLGILQKLSSPMATFKQALEFARAFVAVKVPAYWYNEFWTQDFEDYIREAGWQLMYRIDEDDAILTVLQRVEIVEELNVIRKHLKKTAKANAVEAADINIVSFPKSGRTWVRYFIASWLEDQFDVEHDLELVPQIYWSDKRRSLDFPKINFTHDFFDLNQDNNEEVDILYDYKTPIVFMFRNPFDTIVSYYYQKVKRENLPVNIDIDEFVLDPTYGLSRYCRWFTKMIEYLRDKQHCIILTYEDMQSDMAVQMERLFKYIGVKSSKNVLRKIANKSNFSEMQKVEMASGGDKTGRLTLSNWDGDIQKLKVRNGQINSWKTELKQETIDVLLADPDVKAVLKYLQTAYPDSFPKL